MQESGVSELYSVFPYPHLRGHGGRFGGTSLPVPTLISQAPILSPIMLVTIALGESYSLPYPRLQGGWGVGKPR